MTFRLTSLSILFALSTVVTACSNDSDTEASGEETSEGELDAKAIAEIESLADRAVAAGIPGVSLSILRGKQSLSMARGVSDRATGEALSPDHHLRMASVAKSLVASVVLQLAEEGELRLTDTLDQWLPGILPAHGAVTIELLLRQESGIFDFGSDERWMAPYLQGDLEYAWAPRALVGLSADHPPTFPPRERFEYSNTNYTLLALIIEQVTGDSLANVIRQRITEPLGMSESSMPTTSELPQPFAHGYMLGMGDPIDVTGISASAVFGCGNLVSTPLDLAIFYRELVAGRVVSKEQLPMMLSKDPEVPSTKYAMGVFRFEPGEFLQCDTFVGHDGGIPGYASAAYSSLDGKRQFAITVNSMTLDEKAGGETAQKAFRELVEAIGCK